jgi:hypothetical protein
MAFYRGVIEEHVVMKSANKGTPGIEFKISIREKKHQGKWVPVDWFERRTWLYFPADGDVSYAMKKLAFAGYDGTGLASLNMRGNAVELVSNVETYKGKEREKFEMALPGGGGEMSESNDNAFLAIDAVLQSEALPDVAKAEAPAKGGGPGDGASDAPPRERTALDAYNDAEAKRLDEAAAALPDDEVPF